jgi:cytochrome c-type biogenesis protein CcmH
MFVIFASLVVLAVLLTLSYPLYRPPTTVIPIGDEAVRKQARIDLAIEKQTLLSSIAELDLDLAQGRLAETDHKRLKAVDEHRLARVLHKIDQLPVAEGGEASAAHAASAPPVPPAAAGAGRVAAAFTTAVVIVASAAGIYLYIQGKIGLEAARRAAQSGASTATAGMPNPAEMVARLEQRLKENPNDLEGQMMAGRSYMTLQRMDDARKAWSKVLELDPGNYEANYFLGLILLQTTTRDDTAALERALEYFNTALVKVPREPAVLWYKGVVQVHLKNLASADESWTGAFQNLAPGSEDADFVKQALQDLRSGKPPLF